MIVSFGRLLLFIFALSSSIFVFTFDGLAQDLDDVTISGKITDSNNAPIVGASVTATQLETAVDRIAVTDKDGFYRINDLPPGTYNVKAAAENFGAKENKKLIAIAGQSLLLNFALAPASFRIEQIIAITDEDAPVIDTTRTIVGGTITEREIEELPNNTRNPFELVLTLGGTSEEALSTRDLAEDRDSFARLTPIEQGNFSLSGGASYSNNITIDGLDNNDDRLARERFQPSLESIAEVQVVTNQFSAEYGRASGGRINLRTRGGTKKFRGRVFMFFRDDNLNANTFNNNRRGIPRLPLTEYNPGFTFGGPFIKKRLFFFVAYEYDTLLDTTLIDTLVPIGRNPRFSLPAPTNSQAARNENPPTSTLIAPYVAVANTPLRNNTFTTRIDGNFTDTHNFTFGLQIGRNKNLRQSRRAGNLLDEAIQGRTSDTDAFNFTDNLVINAKTVNQFRFQYSRYTPDFASRNPLDPVILIALRDSSTGLDRRTGTLIAGNSTANFASTRKETRFQFQDSLSHIQGTHSFKIGFDAQRVNSTNLDLGDATGTYNFNSAGDFVQNILTRFRQNFGQSSEQKNTYFGIFAQDEWRAKPNLTVSYGLRYEREMILDDTDNFSPRFAVAWNPFKEAKGVIRFGAGVFYNRVLLRTVDDFTTDAQQELFDTNRIGTSSSAVRLQILQAIAAAFPKSFAASNDLKSLINPILAANNIAANTGFTTFNALSRTLDPNLKIPESYQFNVGFERQIHKDFVFEANYTWNRTVRLWREFNPNAPRTPDGFADLTDYLVRCSASGTTAVCPFLSSNVRFELAGRAAPDSRAAGSLIFVNLDSLNPSQAASSPIGRALEAVRSLRANPAIEQTEQVSSIGRAFYQGLILELRRRYRRLRFGFGSSFRVAYTLSSSKNDGLNNTSDAQINGNFPLEYARSLQDRRHRLSISGTFDTPLWLGKLRFSPIIRLASSAPFNVGIGGVDRNLDDVSNDRPNFTGNLKDIRSRKFGSPAPVALLSQFSLAPIGSRGGNLPRSAGRGPGLFLFDLNVSRAFRFGERFRLRPIVEFDNILNHTTFSFGSEFIDFSTFSLNATPQQREDFARSFLVPTRTFRPRQIRIGIRFDF